MKVTGKGQITIPKHIREKYAITPNSEVDFVEVNNRIFLIKKKSLKNQGRFQRFRGIATVKMTTDEIMSLMRDK
jgi:AbrB family looped-hinge helix DNA binding protein